MYRCPNCSAGMRYDIYKRSLKCDYCGYICAAENHPQQQEEAARDDYEVTLFSCPQCGGQIRSTDNAATDFCSYCGASVVLEGRLVNEKKPAYIIPFSRTKEECKEVFKKRAKKAWCLPNAYKDPKKLEKFTGIYIPYWVYDVSQHAEPTVQGVRRAGAYTEYCNMNLEINLNYRWIYYDAALGFSDDLSDMISDYSSKDIEKFCGAYLSGFYADSPDVKEATYIEDAALVSCDSTIATAKKKYTDVYFEKVIDPLSTFNVQVEDARMALFPVWFCTWRNKGRVSYAVVNGQTLKAAADLPVSFPKFLFYSLLFAVPFAVLFLFLPSITPQVTLWVYLLVGMWTILQNYSTAMAYVRRESHLTDKGRLLSTESGWKLWKKGHDKKMEKMAEEKRRAEWKKSAEEAERKRKIETGEEEESPGCGSCLLAFVLPGFISGFLSLAFLQVFSNTPDNLPMIFVEGVTPFIAIILSIAIPIIIIKGTTPKRLLLTILPDTLFLSAAVAAASCVMMTRPVKDLYYYIAALAVFAGILVGYLAIFHRFNLSCTRPIPNYHERGDR